MASPSASDKWRFTLYSTLVLVLLFNPWTYNLTNSLLSNLVGTIANKGCPTMFGFVVHVIVWRFCYIIIPIIFPIIFQD